MGMNTVVAFLGILFTSLVVALLAALQLGDFFNAQSELAIVLALIALFSVFAFGIFAAIYGLSGRARDLNTVALLLAVIACVPLVWPGLARELTIRSANPYVEK